MKKVITTFIICTICILTTLFFVKNPTITTKIANSIIYIADEITSVANVEYSSDFKVNKLQTASAEYYYTKLDDNQKNVYSSFANSIKNLSKKVKLENYNYTTNEKAIDDIDKSVAAFFSDHPEVYYVNSKYSIETMDSLFGTNISLNINYSVNSKSELENQLSQIEKTINEYITPVKGLTGIEAEIMLHDNLAKNVEYYTYNNIEELPQESHGIYGAFISKKAVCDGLSKAMQILLDRVNIQSILVVGSLSSEPHAWNMVNLDNQWYQLDITSNKSVKNIDIKDNLVVHSYFNITTTQLLNTHEFEQPELIPQTTDTKYNYYIYTGKYIKSTDYFSSKFKEILEKNKDNNLIEFGTDIPTGVPDKISNVLRTQAYKDYLSGAGDRFTYYKVLDSYIIPKSNKE